MLRKDRETVRGSVVGESERPGRAAVRGFLTNKKTFLTSKESGPVTQKAEVNEKAMTEKYKMCKEISQQTF